MKKKKAMSQMKGKDKQPPPTKKKKKKINVMEIGNLPEKEFWIMIVKMTQSLGEKMEKKMQ